MAGTLTVGQLAPDVGTNLYINAQQYGGNVIVGNTTTTLLNISPSGNTTVNGTATINGVITSNTITSNTGASLVLQSNNTTAITVDTSQNSTFAGSISSGSINSPNTFGFKNRIMNGGMVIDQRNSAAQITAAGNVYTVDRFLIQGSQTGKFNVQQVTDAPSGFVNSLKITVGTAVTVGSGDYFILRQPIEGYNTADLGFGTANAQTVTLSFWTKSSLTGLHSGHLTNASSGRWYAYTYTINSANTWEYKTITISGDATGTWLKDNSTGIYVGWSLGTGSTNQAAGSNTWSSSVGIGAPSEVNTVATLGATFYVTGVQLEKGSTATSFDYRPYGTELQLCQRYYETGGFVSFTSGGVNGIYQPIQFKVTKRVAAASCTTTNGRSLTMNIFNDGTGVATGMYQGSNDSGASVSTWTVSAEL